MNHEWAQSSRHIPYSAILLHGRLQWTGVNGRRVGDYWKSFSKLCLSRWGDP